MPLLQVAEQIRAAQQKAALSGQAPAAWAIGARCEALYAGDGQWYSATVKGVTGTGNFLVSFDEYGTEEEVGLFGVLPHFTALSKLHSWWTACMEAPALLLLAAHRVMWCSLAGAGHQCSHQMAA